MLAVRSRPEARYPRWRLALASSLALAWLGCDRDDESRAAPAASAPAASATVEAGPPAPWYLGEWRGTYTAKPHRIDVDKRQGLAEWNTDAGPSDEQGPIDLRVDESGAVSGKLEGPLGPLTIRGEVHEETLTAQLNGEPNDGGDALHGYIVAEHADDTLAGDLRGSSARSTLVRVGTVELKKAH